MRTLILALVLVSSAAHAGTFNVVESPPRKERTPFGNVPQELPPVRMGSPTLEVRSAGEYFVDFSWSAEVRAWGRSHCYVEAQILDSHGRQITWVNDNAYVTRNSNGYTTAQGSFTLGRRDAAQVATISATATCN